MPLSSAQLNTLKADILANSGTIPAGQPWTGGFAGVQVKNVPNTGDGNVAVAGYYSQAATPSFWVWRTSVTRENVYTTVSDLATPTVWNWTTYKGQSAVEQGAWTQMFMGDSCNFGNLNNRSGVSAIFGAAGTQRNHVFAIARRTALRIEKLFAVAVTAVGGLNVDATTGNVLTDALGATTNPALLVADGPLSSGDVNTALNLP